MLICHFISLRPDISADPVKYFLAIATPSSIAQQIEDFRSPWGSAKTAPHITVKAPNSLGEPKNWLPQVNELCRQVAPFDVILAGVGRFNATALYLRVASAELVDLHQALLRITTPPPAEQAEYFEGIHYLPHLTLAHTESGITTEALAAMLPLAQERWAHPTRFVAETVIAYQSVGAGQPYTQYQIVPFSGPGSSLAQAQL